ncbi:MAG: hypothetical protein ACLF0G_07775 [Candidatus Brocadiia bacterium]
MSIREAFLFALLLVLATTAFRQAHQRNRQLRARLVRREAALRRNIACLQDAKRHLRREVAALHGDRYYLERMARAHLRWRPRGGDAGCAPYAPPGYRQEAEVLARGPAVSGGPHPDGPRALSPGNGRALLSALGYDSVEHFQRKMMSDHVTGEVDMPTVQRARELVTILRKLGFGSVEAFQREHGLKPDGILGRRTEQRARELLRTRQPSAPAYARNGAPSDSRTGG